MLESWPTLVSVGVFFILLQYQRRAEIRNRWNWYAIFYGAAIIATISSLKLVATLLGLTTILQILAVVQPPVLIFGETIFMIGLVRQVPQIVRMSRLDPLLRQILVELGEEPDKSTTSVVALTKQVQAAIQRYKDTLDALRESQARNDALIAAIPDAMFEISADGICMKSLTPQHDFVRDLVGSHLGKHITDILPEDVAASVMHKIKATLSQQTLQRLEYELEDHGEFKQFEARYVPLETDSVLGIVRDVTEESRLAYELNRVEQRYRTLLQHSQDAIAIHNIDGTFVDVNHQALELFGYSREELLDNNWLILLPANAPPFLQKTRSTLRKQGHLTGETLLQRKDGSQFFASISASLIHIDDVPLTIAIVRDVSEQKQAQFALEAANVELEAARTQLEARVEQRTVALQQANRDLETLLYVISHDLKEPLRAIENFSLLVNKRYAMQLDAKGQDFLMRVVRGAQRMRVLISDILRLSRAHRMEVRFDEVLAQQLVDDVLARLEMQIDELDAQIIVRPNLPTLFVNITWASEALYNLVSNALKYHVPGERPNIEIDGFYLNHQLGLVVRDQGIGVAPEHHERIFELFQRNVGRDVEGTGTGLAIVREVAQRHGGDVWVESCDGGGAAFYIAFGRIIDLNEEVML